MTEEIQLRAIGPPQQDLLIALYDRFDPLGAALGLPPHTVEARHGWVESALCQRVNVAAFSQAGEVVGHSFFAADNPAVAEVAVFVHKEFRRRGIGAALLKKALEWGRAAGLERAWAVTASGNRAALRLLVSCGFRQFRSDSEVAELDIDWRVPPAFASRAGALQTHISNRTGSSTEKEEF